MTTSKGSRLRDLLEQFTDLESTENQAIDDIIHTSLTGIIVWIIRKTTSEEERNDLIEQSLSRFMANACAGFNEMEPKPVQDDEFKEQLEKNLAHARIQLRSLLIK